MIRLRGGEKKKKKLTIANSSQNLHECHQSVNELKDRTGLKDRVDQVTIGTTS